VEFADQPVIIRQRLVPGSYQSVLLQFNASGDPDKFTFLFWHSSQIGRSNLGSYRNEEVDRLIMEGKVESNHDERIRIYQSIHRLIAADRPAAFLFIRRIFLGAQAKFKGIIADPSLFYRSIKDWQLKEKAQNERR
jgi:ABC-type transport system substrate-binding protein